jgi:hypothetical protein
MYGARHLALFSAFFDSKTENDTIQNCTVATAELSNTTEAEVVHGSRSFPRKLKSS